MVDMSERTQARIQDTLLLAADEVAESEETVHTGEQSEEERGGDN